MHSFIYNMLIKGLLHVRYCSTLFQGTGHTRANKTDWNPSLPGIGHLWELLILECRVIFLFPQYLIWYLTQHQLYDSSFNSQCALSAYYVPQTEGSRMNKSWSLLMGCHSPWHQPGRAAAAEFHTGPGEQQEMGTRELEEARRVL